MEIPELNKVTQRLLDTSNGGCILEDTRISITPTPWKRPYGSASKQGPEPVKPKGEAEIRLERKREAVAFIRWLYEHGWAEWRIRELVGISQGAYSSITQHLSYIGIKEKRPPWLTEDGQRLENYPPPGHPDNLLNRF